MSDPAEPREDDAPESHEDTDDGEHARRGGSRHDRAERAVVQPPETR